jgi:hypothetical protein
MRKLLGKGLATAAFIAVAVLAASGGCSNQSEGDRCSVLNGNDDCSDGLECVAAAEFLGQSGADICCPLKGNSTSTTLCGLRNNQTATDAAIPEAGPDTSMVPDTSTLPDTSPLPDTSVVPDTSVADAPAEGG